MASEIVDPAIVRIENLRLYLEAHGLEVVHGSWFRGEPYPVLFVRPVGDKKAPLDVAIPPKCKCGHLLAGHDPDCGICLVGNCGCIVYDPGVQP